MVDNPRIFIISIFIYNLRLIRTKSRLWNTQIITQRVMTCRKQTLIFFKFSLCFINLIRDALFPLCSASDLQCHVSVLMWRQERMAPTLVEPHHPPLTENSLHNRFTRTGEFSNPCHRSAAAYSMSKSCTPVEHSSSEKNWQRRVAERQIQLWKPHTREVATETATFLYQKL